jgi:very-short-patch-repair endonuclease
MSRGRLPRERLTGCCEAPHHRLADNLPVIVQDQLYYLDIAFRRHRLALEIDGRIHEDNPSLFESDRWRQNALVFAGWRVLRFTWAMLDRHPEHCVATVRRALP